MGRYQIYCIIFSIFVGYVSSQPDNEWALHTLVPEKILKPDTAKSLDIFCYAGAQKHFALLFQTTKVHINLISDNYGLYYGSTVQEVLKKFDTYSSLWGIIWFKWRSQDLKLYSFNPTCIGVKSRKAYQIQLKIVDIDFWKIMMLCAGVLVFYLAPRLSESVLFFYICGTCINVILIFIALVLAIYKLLLSKLLMYVTVIGGWAVGQFFFCIKSDDIQLIITNNQTHVMWYLLITGIISFLVCYRIGPPTDPRTKNIIKWALQSAGLFCIAFCTEYKEAAAVMIVIILTIYNFPDFLKAKIRSYWKQKFPPKIKLLTDEEFHTQGVKEAKRGLQEFREYYKGLGCSKWRAVLKLKDPVRFERFLEGESHLNNEEILNYSILYGNVTDDESEDERPLRPR